MENKLKNIIHTALNLLLPRFCAGCGKPNEVFCSECKRASYKSGAQCLICGFRSEKGEICRTCRTWKPKNLKSVLWAGRYDGPLKEAVWQFKYKKRKELAKPLAEMLWKKFFETNFMNFEASVFQNLAQSRHGGTSRAIPQQRDMRVLQNTAPLAAIIPIPLHFKKEYERRFNQAELLAKEFSYLSNFPLLTHSLLKVKETPAQVEVENKEDRIANLENAFEINPKFSTSNLSLLTSRTLILVDDVATTGATLIHASDALAEAGAKNVIGLVVAHGG